ncbi:MAG: holo-ACP synthase [Verrucomicrobia bacterium]|nr:holo-ACP synthase [Verrucomicrobiota bacterium]
MNRIDQGTIASGALSVVGTGIDLVEVARFRQVLEQWRERFTRRVFLEAERRYCESRPHPWMHYAVRFAVKEAVAKAFGTGISLELGWQDIEVVADPATRAPSVRFSPKGQALAAQRCITRVLVSLSHTHDYAVAQAILVEGKNQTPDDGRQTTEGRRKNQ